MAEINKWIKVFRLRTYRWLSHQYSWPLFSLLLWPFPIIILVLSLSTTLFLQILSNLANDYGDAESGVDGPGRIELRFILWINYSSSDSNYFCAFFAFISGLILVVYVFEDQWFNLLFT